MNDTSLSARARHEIRRIDRTRTILFAVLIVTMLAIGWGTDRKSCLRSNAIRESLSISYQSTITRANERAGVEHGLARKLDLQAAQAAGQALSRVHQLSCGLPLPTTE